MSNESNIFSKPLVWNSVFENVFRNVFAMNRSAYSVLGFEPGLVLDFDDEYYRLGEFQRQFSDAITHTRASTATYVDGTGTLQTAAINEPRVGHHVWNGTAWVNEGLLHESEARTNIVPLSVPSTSGWATPSTVLTTNEIASPTGAVDGSKVVANTSNAEHYIEETFSVTSGSVYTFSVFLKKLGYSNVAFRIPAVGFANNAYLDVNMDAGTVAYGGGTIDAFGIENAGNGWFRVYMTRTASANATALFRVQPNTTSAYIGDNLSGVYVWGAQAELGQTVSSHIPTSGSTVTRAADVLTIPAANLPWPSPVVIGPELVTNGTFDTDTTGWTDNSAAGGSIAWNAAGYLDLDADAATSRASQDIAVTAGSVYAVSITVVNLGGSSASALYLDGAASSNINFVVEGVGTHTIYYVAPDSLLNISIRNFTTGTTVSIDNVSVREINPLAVSIQMDGRMTYADEGNFGTVVPFRRLADSNNSIEVSIDTASAETGEINAKIRYLGTQFTNNFVGNEYQPDVLVPINISGRFGSNFVNSAKDGIADTAITTPTGLPDLSTADLNLGYDYNGTIRTFRIWGQDIGDAGLVEATEPSLVPSLSLTFDGTENSFIVEDWSE